MGVSLHDMYCGPYSLWMKLTSPAWNSSLVLAKCYITPLSSDQLHDFSLDSHFNCLTSHAFEAKQHGDVYLFGDFNARIGTLPEAGSLQLPARGCTDLVVNSHGRRLISFCQSSGFRLSTGRSLGDRLAPLSFRARRNTQGSRLDHVLASETNASTITYSSVCLHRLVL